MSVSLVAPLLFSLRSSLFTQLHAHFLSLNLLKCDYSYFPYSFSLYIFSCFTSDIWQYIGPKRESERRVGPTDKTKQRFVMFALTPARETRARGMSVL